MMIGTRQDSFESTIDPKLKKIHKLFRASANGTKSVKYIVSGDSTRNRVNNYITLDYYVPTLAQIGVTVYNNAAASQTALDWTNNTDQNTLQQAIDNSSGVGGCDTILEYSFGLNDYSNYIATQSEATIKSYIKNGIIAYQNAKPSAIVVLVKPPKNEAIARSAFLDTCYNELSVELNLFMVDSYIPTSPYVANYSYYDDSTHPNIYLSRRMANYVFSKIIPKDLTTVFNILEMPQPVSVVTNLLTGVPLVQGYYQTSGSIGVLLVQTKSRSTAKFNIDDRFSVDVTLVGTNRTEIFFYDSTGACMTTSTLYTDGKVPRGAVQCALNLYIGADASAGTLFETTYGTSQSLVYMANSFRTQSNINENLDMKIPVQTRRNNRTIDEYGFTGEIGQSLKIDSNGKMKWMA